MSVLPTEPIEVTDPTHPLFGLTFPCLGITTKPVLGRVCVVWLAPGVERLISVAATSLVAPARPPAPCRLSAPAVQALLAVLAAAGVAPAPPPDQEDADAATATAAPPAAPPLESILPATAAAAPPGAPAPAPGVDRPLTAAPGPAPPGPHRPVAGGGPCR